MAWIGYARVSTLDQNLDAQMDALRAAGCTRIFADTASGKNTQRPELNNMLDFLRAGDVVTVYKLDRLGRNLKDLLALVETLKQRDIQFKSLNDPIDTTTPAGALTLQIFGALAEYERNLIRERTQAGLKAARARGRKGGRPKKLTDAKIKAIALMHADKNVGIEEIIQTFKIGRSTLYKALTQARTCST